MGLPTTVGGLSAMGQKEAVVVESGKGWDSVSDTTASDYS